MTTQEVADKYYQLAKEGKWEDIQNQFYAEDAVSIEKNREGEWWTAEGIDAIKAKGKEWNESIEEFHSGYTNEPIAAGNHFSCAMGMDITMKGAGRMKMDEVCVFEVKDGKIVKEQFFY